MIHTFNVGCSNDFKSDIMQFDFIFQQKNVIFERDLITVIIIKNYKINNKYHNQEYATYRSRLKALE